MKFSTFVLYMSAILGILYYFGNCYDWDARAQREGSQICFNQGYKKAILRQRGVGQFDLECAEPLGVKPPVHGLP